MFIVFFGSVILKDSPLNAVQMLWVNLIMDTFAALALATEPPALDILERQPYHKDAPIMTEVMWRNVFGHFIYQAIVLIVVIFVGQGMLVNNYSASCMTYDPKDVKVCTGWNPFYANDLYVEPKDHEFWKEKALSYKNFDETLIQDLSCSTYLSKNEKVSRKNFQCADFLKKNPKYKITPLDIEEGTGTQKLLHYTYVF